MIGTIASLVAALAVQAAPAAAPASGDKPTEVSGVEVPGQKPQIKVSRREIAIAKKQLKSRPDVVVCKRLQVTGSRFPGPPVCKKNIEWDLHETEKRRNLDRILGNQWVRPCTGPKC